MSCSPFDLHDYLLEELTESERRQVDAHVRSCARCQEEMERLRITQSTLLELRDEEVPQRIGFVSDPVFEPSRARRVWRAFWGSGPKLGFPGAAMLSAALLLFTFFRPVAAPPPAVSAQFDAARIEQQVSERIAVEVRKAVAESEARQQKKTAELLAAAEQRHDQQQQAFLKNVSYLEKQYSMMARASYETGGLR